VRQFACLGESGRLVSALLGDRVIPYRLACSGVWLSALPRGGGCTGVPLVVGEAARTGGVLVFRRLFGMPPRRDAERVIAGFGKPAGVGEYLAVRPVQG